MKLYINNIKHPRNPNFLLLECSFTHESEVINVTFLAGRTYTPGLWDTIKDKTVEELKGKYITTNTFVGMMKDVDSPSMYAIRMIQIYEDAELAYNKAMKESIMGPDQIFIQQMNQTTDLEFDFNEFKVQPIIMPHTHVPSFKVQPVNHNNESDDCDGMCCDDCTVAHLKYCTKHN